MIFILIHYSIYLRHIGCVITLNLWSTIFIWYFNTLRPRPNGRRNPDDISKCILLNENICIPIKISLKFVPKGHINNIPSLVQIMAWRRPGDKPLFEPMMVDLVMYICVTRPQWVNVKYILALLCMDLHVCLDYQSHFEAIFKYL